MFRLAVRLQSRSFSKSSRLYSTPSKVISVRISPSLWSASDNYLQPETPPKFSTPKDWKIIETHLGGIERSFVHRKTKLLHQVHPGRDERCQDPRRSWCVEVLVDN